MSYVYISYSRKDSLIAELISRELVNNDIDIWIDKVGIEGGMNWQSEILQAINHAFAVVVLLSENSVNSDFIRYEIGYSLGRGDLLIIPVITGNFDFESIPSMLRAIQWLQLTPPYKESITQLVDAIKLRQTQFIEGVEKPTQEELAREQSQLETEIKRQERVFIAYSRSQKVTAKRLSEILYKNEMPNFWDIKIKAGAVWRQTIQKALDDCTHLVVIWTNDAAKSDEVEREVSYALSEGKIIIPLLSKDIPKLPYHLHGFQYVVFEEDISLVEQDLIEAIEFNSTEDLWN